MGPHAQRIAPLLPADVAVVSRGGWQRHSWKSSNQDAFLALPLAAGSADWQGCASDACCPAAVAIGVFDGHGRAGQAAAAHLRNALASGLLVHNQLALMARPACQPGQDAAHAAHARRGAAAAAGSEEPGGCDPAGEAAALLERCFAAAAATMPSTGVDFSLSGSTAVMCLVQPGRWAPLRCPPCCAGRVPPCTAGCACLADIGAAAGQQAARHAELPAASEAALARSPGSRCAFCGPGRLTSLALASIQSQRDGGMGGRLPRCAGPAQGRPLHCLRPHPRPQAQQVTAQPCCLGTSCCDAGVWGGRRAEAGAQAGGQSENVCGRCHPARHQVCIATASCLRRRLIWPAM